MPFNGSGTYNPAAPAYPAVSGTVIYADDWNSIVEDIADALSNCVTRDGQSPPTADIPMGGKKITGLANGTASTDAVNYGQVFTGATFTNASFVGTVVMESASLVTAPTRVAGDSTKAVATTEFVTSAGLSSALPGQTGNGGAEITTDGAAASWGFYCKRIPRIANTMLTKANNRNLIDIIAGPFIQTFDTAPNLGNGWSVRIRNNSGQDITIDPAGAETCDGLSSFIMYDLEVRDFYSDGVNLYSIPIVPFLKKFTASGNFIKPPGYGQFRFKLWAGGSSGAKSGNLAVTAVGGGGGGYAEILYPAALVAATQGLVVGSGGAAQTVAPSVGAVGTASVVTGLFSVQGSAIYYDGGSVYPGLIVQQNFSVVGGVGFEGGSTRLGQFDNNNSVQGGAASCHFATKIVAGSSIWGGAAGGAASSSGSLASPGTSYFGGNGGAAGTTTSGVDGTAPGGGGGATQTGATSGAGARGEIQVEGVM